MYTWAGKITMQILKCKILMLTIITTNYQNVFPEDILLPPRELEFTGLSIIKSRCF